MVLTCALSAWPATARPATPHTAATAAAAASAPHPTAELVHDHTPRHGGVVGMAGSRHVEAALDSDGLLRVYLTDLHRVPLPLDGLRGTATMTGGREPDRTALGVRAGALGALEGRVQPPARVSADVRVKLVLRDGEVLLIDFTLPVTATPR